MTSRFTDADLHAAGQRLIQAGIENGLQEARWIYEHLVEQGSPNVRRDVSDLIERRCQREPLQHILGRWAFFDIELKTDARALIPRSDTEPVIALAFRRLGINPLAKQTSDAAIRVADLGTGSGAILATLLSRLPQSSGVAIEASNRALDLARENFEALGLSPRIEPFCGSWTDWRGWADCDLIISNPPYIRRDVLATLAPEVRDFDPIGALDGGVDGLDAYREIITLAAAHMKSGADLVFEIGFDQKTSVSALLVDAGFENLEHMQDLGGQDRGIAATKS